MSKLTFTCTEHACALQFLLSHSPHHNSHVISNGLHKSHLPCTAWELHFVCCTWSILRVLHDSKKHAWNTLCAACESVFLCAACKLAEKNQGIQWNGTLANVIENSILSSIYILLFQSTLDDIVSNQLNAKHNYDSIADKTHYTLSVQ